MKDIGHERTESALEATQEKMLGIYSDLQKELKKQLSDTLDKIEDINADDTLAQKMAKVNKYNRLQKLEEELTAMIANANKDAMAITQGLWRDVYNNNYDWARYEIESVADDVRIPSLTKSAINAVVKDEISPFTMIALDDIADKSQAFRMISRELISGITLGESNQKMAKRLTSVVDRNYNQAIRIARTETTRIEGNARNDVYKLGKEKYGLTINKRWVATSGGRTRDAHRKLDGQVVAEGEKFKINGDEAEYPGDFKRADMNINCRCTTVAEVVGYGKPKQTFDEWEEGK